MSLQESANRYELRYGGIRFWAPYWINWPGVTASPLKGKASPEELQMAIEAAFSADPYPPESAEEMRFQMLRNALGIDCSAFVYHTLSDWLESQGVPLVGQLSIPRDEVVRAVAKDSWRKIRVLTEEELRGLPDSVPLQWVVETFQRKPEHLVNVARLCNTVVSKEVSVSEKLATGDMVYIKGKYGDHIQLVTAVEGGTVTVMQSRYEALGPGGVTEEVLDTGGELFKRGVIWRLRCLGEGLYERS